MKGASGQGARVAVLFARADSVYRQIDGCEVYDRARDALSFNGGMPVVAHPPCRAWGRLRAFANPRPGEMDLARWAIGQVRAWGGVLEHPAGSALWQDMALPRPGQPIDKFGGWTFAAPQIWWGHRARKESWFYIAGIGAREIPEIPFDMAYPDRTVDCLGKAAREHTPRLLAEWLFQLASSCSKKAPRG